MIEQQKSEKRIVTKKTHLKAEAKRAGFALGGVALLYVVIFSVTITFIFLLVFMVMLAFSIFQRSPEGAAASLIFLLIGLLSGAVTYWLGRQGIKSLQRADRITDSIALIHAEAADLPASSLLVRGSQEPRQVQEAVLLRAAAAGPATQAKELLRAATDDQEQA